MEYMGFHKNKKSIWKIVAVLSLLLGFSIFLYKPISHSVNYFLGGQLAVVETRDVFFDEQQAVDGFRTYRNLLFRFSLLVPEELSLREYSEGNTSTFVFEDRSHDSTRGFQIFIVPYEGSEISTERFKMDIPSGVVAEPQDIMIDGVRGSMFFSTNAVLGETREVWFIKNGFLYEVTARKELDSWLSQTMRTWKFR